MPMRAGPIARAAECAWLEHERAILERQVAAWEQDAVKKALFTRAAALHERAATVQERGVSHLLMLERRRAESGRPQLGAAP